MSNKNASREHALIDAVHKHVGLGIHAAVIVEANVLGLIHSFDNLDPTEKLAVRKLVIAHGFEDAEWAKPLDTQSAIRDQTFKSWWPFTG